MGCIGSLHEASEMDRRTMMMDLTGDGSLSDSDESPTSGFGECETALMVDTHKDIHGCLVRLMELGTIEEIKDLIDVFAEAFSTPPPDPESSDESMPEETRSQRLRRYQNSTQAEISDPDEWADVHYGPEAPNDDGVQEF